ncbi:hypothetical protein SAMN05421676_102340 [Salinibacillus kushneri]|uniref:Uncharacterized protein n=1 Tax=Salinibacillus kushneri TaxID=237682 RepID=A0A1I0B5H5_9BACI|nr:hypothetical protein [Salinibacillus kushneri]SET01245.1 hypothetical protein SAMN05421676_102340 [Salinibacillus kushneri]
MEQVDIYEYFGTESDPLFQEINQLENGGYIELEQGIIRKNELGIYEIETEDIHEASKSPVKVYEKLAEMINEKIMFQET